MSASKVSNQYEKVCVRVFKKHLDYVREKAAQDGCSYNYLLRKYIGEAITKRIAAEERSDKSSQ